MSKSIKTLFVVMALTAVTFPLHSAERAEEIDAVHMLWQPSCPLTPTSLTDVETKMTKEFLGAAIAMALGGIAGDLVKSGVTAAGDALEQASKEKGFIAEAVATVPLIRLANRTEVGGKLATLNRLSPCLVMYANGSTGDISKLGEDPLVKALDLTADTITDATKLLQERGVTRLPSLYVEALVLSYPEGLVIRPSLVWYREKLSGAPKSAAAAELHVALAVPGASDLGTLFSAARLPLPNIMPGQLVSWNALASYRSPMLLPRPTAGFVETTVAAANAAYATFGTREKEKIVAERSLAAAQARHSTKPTDDTAAALRIATDALTDAQSALKIAEAEAASVKSADIGSSNVKLRFVVIRSPNEFGLALAKALKGQAEAAGKAVTDGLKSTPDWTAADTTYLTARVSVDAKQREYDAAVAAGDSAAIARIAGELAVVKAKLNEAAAGSNRPLPYPSLLP
jgi:hypothetical protein